MGLSDDFTQSRHKVSLVSTLSFLDSAAEAERLEQLGCDAVLWETRGDWLGPVTRSLCFWLEKRRGERGNGERKRTRWQQALAGVLRTLDGPGAINLLLLLHAAVPHECLWEYRNATADL